MAASVEKALEELYDASPATFTATRDRLAKELRASGDDEGAAAIAARRKPTQIAHVLNQLARRHADELAELVDVGRELARVQRTALRGGSATGLREAIERQRKVVAELTSKAAAVMRDLGIDPRGHLDEIAGALHAALVDPAVGDALEAGRLEKTPAATAGFPGAAPQEEERPAPRARAEEPRDGRDAQRRAAAQRAEAKAHAKADRAEARRAATAARDEAKRRAAEERALAKGTSERRADDARARKARKVDEARAQKADAARAAAAKTDQEANDAAAAADARDQEAARAREEAERLSTEARRLAAEVKAVAARAMSAEKRAAKADRDARAARVAAKRAASRASAARAKIARS